MSLLLDQNLSHKVSAGIADLFPGVIHVKDVKLERADDAAIAKWAVREAYVIVSKDGDFYHRTLLHGHMLKFVWLRAGNCSTAAIVEMLRSNAEVIRSFCDSGPEAVLILARDRR